MIADFGYVGILLIVGILFTLTTLLLPVALRYFKIVPKKRNPAKESTYECGMETIGKTWIQFNFRYYFFAVMFVALDVLTVFLYPWAVNAKELGLYGFIAVGIFFVILMVVYVYAWLKGALEWK
ncbi:MAG TPA: NADH-quinone oxidoreductase subunit A [Dehalococcoidia bacterium]